MAALVRQALSRQASGRLLKNSLPGDKKYTERQK
jgi:hypothetical protein